MADAVWLVTALLCLNGTRWVWIIGQRKGPAPVVCSTAACCAPAPAPHLPVASHQSVYSHPSPKKAAIKSPLKTTTGLDSHKLEQNNLFLSSYLSLFLPSCLPIPISALSRLPSLPVPIHLRRQRWREPRAPPGATRFRVVYGCVLYWCELIPSGNTFVGCSLGLPSFWLPDFQLWPHHA